MKIKLFLIAIVTLLAGLNSTANDKSSVNEKKSITNLIPVSLIKDLPCSDIIGLNNNNSELPPNLSGVWKRNDGIEIRFVQKGDDVKLFCTVGKLQHTADLKYVGNNVYKGVMIRKNTEDGCVTTLNVKFERISKTKMKQNESATEGKCGLSANYTHEFILTNDYAISDEANKFFQDGLNAIFLLDYEKAMNYFTKAIELAPKFADAYAMRAKFCYTDMKNSYKEVMEDYTKAIAADPANGDYYYQRGYNYFRHAEKNNKSKENDKLACDDLNKAKELGYKDADSEINRYCK